MWMYRAHTRTHTHACVCACACAFVSVRVCVYGRYEGEWAYGQKHGRGTLFLANGDKYESDWRNGERQVLSLSLLFLSFSLSLSLSLSLFHSFSLSPFLSFSLSLSLSLSFSLSFSLSLSLSFRLSLSLCAGLLVITWRVVYDTPPPKKKPNSRADFPLFSFSFLPFAVPQQTLVHRERRGEKGGEGGGTDCESERCLESHPLLLSLSLPRVHSLSPCVPPLPPSLSPSPCYPSCGRRAAVPGQVSTVTRK